MPGCSSKKPRWRGGSHEAFSFLAALAAFSGSLAGCGARTGLNLDESIAPEGQGGACSGSPAEFFLAVASDTPSGADITAMDLHPSRGDGTFGAPLKIDIKEPFTGVVVDDFDRDGSLEIHLWGVSSGVEYLLDYSCAMRMWLKSPIVGGALPPRYDTSATGDVNNDGYIDIVGWIPQKDDAGQPNPDAFEVYTSLGGPGGAFAPGGKSGLNLKNKFVWWLAPARHIRDMDSDGCADLLFIKYDDGGPAKSSIYLAKGDCAGGFGEPKKVASTPFPGTANDVGDIDGDGAMDLITGMDDDGDPGQTWVVKGDGAGSLGSPSPVFDVVGEESGHDGAGAGLLFLYDWNHDGKLDALSIYTTGPGFSAPQIDIRINTGELTFSAPSVVVPAPMAVKRWFVGPASK